MEPTITSSKEIGDLIARLVTFRDARDWQRIHTVKDLALSVSLEASELLELTQWQSEEEIAAAMKMGDLRVDFADEIADVLIYLLLLCEKLRIDPVAAAAAKIERNESRFPAVHPRGDCSVVSEPG